MRRQLVPTNDAADEQTSNHSRRQFLLGVGAGTAMLAGCISGDDDDDDESDEQEGNGGEEENGEQDGDTDESQEIETAYTDWLTTQDDWLYMASINLDIESDDEIEIDPDEGVDDPLVSFPLAAGGTTIGLFSTNLVATDLLPLLEMDEEFEPETEFESNVERMLVVNGVTVVEGTLDTDELHEHLTDEGIQSAATYERTDELHGYDRYDPAEVPDNLDEAPVVAVGEEALLLGANVDMLEQIAATEAGDRSAATDDSDTVVWLVEQTGDADLVFGQVGPVPDTEFDLAEIVDEQFTPGDGEDVMTAATFDTETDELDVQFALTAEDLTDDTRETADEEFGTMGTDVSVDIDNDRITASGTYDATEIGAGADGGRERDELSSEEAEALVPEGALEFRYVPSLDQPFGELWVDIGEDTDARAVRVEADSGGHNELSSPDGTVGAGTGIPVQVDPDGDEITVFAIDETDAIGELTSKQVPTDELAADEAEQAVPEDALSFTYDPPEAGNLGSLQIEVVDEIDAEALAVRPREASGSSADNAGSIDADQPVAAGTTLRTPVDPGGDEVLVFATVGQATGEVTQWEGPE